MVGELQHTGSFPPIRSVYDLIREKYGVDAHVVVNRTTSDIDTTSKIIALNDPARVALVVMNLAANPVYLNPIDIATVAAGLRLDATGGSVSMDWQKDMILPALEWHGISSVANQAIIVIEVLLS